MADIIRGEELDAFAFMLGIMMAVVLCFRILAPKLVDRLAPHLDAEKRGKCSVYITELIFSSAALLFVVIPGGWDPVWLSDVENKAPRPLYVISLGELAAAWTCAAMYVVELSGEPHMRAGARMVACWLWLPTTEQNVFASMLAYRINPKLSPVVMKLSALLYMATRIFGIIVSLVAFGFYITTGLLVLEKRPGKEVIFAACVGVQTIGFIVMIWAQHNSAKSQWGLAQKQHSKLKEAVESESSNEV